MGSGDTGTGSASDQTLYMAGNGGVVFTLNPLGTFSGTLFFEGSKRPFKGIFNSEGEGIVGIERSGLSPLILSIKTDGPAPGRVTGQLTNGARALGFVADPSVRIGDTHPFAGNRYTILFPAPDISHGHGYAVMTIAADGTAKIVGKLADGTKLTVSPRAVDPGGSNWLLPVHALLYSKATGMLRGEVSLPKVAPANAPDLAAELGWLRPADPKKLQTAFLKPLASLGERYIAPAKGVSFLSGSEAESGFSLVVDPDGQFVTQTGTWPGSNKPLLTNPVASGLKISYTSASGIVKGSFNRPSGTKAVSTKYEGIVFSKPLTPPGSISTIRGGGFFSTAGAAGSVEISD